MFQSSFNCDQYSVRHSISSVLLARFLVSVTYDFIAPNSIVDDDNLRMTRQNKQSSTSSATFLNRILINLITT